MKSKQSGRSDLVNGSAVYVMSFLILTDKILRIKLAIFARQCEIADQQQLMPEPYTPAHGRPKSGLDCNDVLIIWELDIAKPDFGNWLTTCTCSTELIY